tara:strand:+ start:153 stop:407 length:255 start_codon:yes stop_codon:yes gene_type:complete
MTDKQTTRATVRRYLKDPNRCPFCGGEEFLTSEIMSDDLVGENSEVYQWVECNTCESKWRDVYRLAHVDKFKQGDYAKRHGFNL